MVILFLVVRQEVSFLTVFIYIIAILLLCCVSMYVVKDSSRDKPFELEMGWLCEETEWKYTAVPTALV